MTIMKYVGSRVNAQKRNMSCQEWRIHCSLLLLLLTARAQPIYAGCDGFGCTSCGDCGGTVPPSGVLVIPATYPDGQPVTSIAAHAFDGNSLLTSVIMPDSVTNIGDYAFSSCYNLTNVTMGNGLT